jgi:hypothetical protein
MLALADSAIPQCFESTLQVMLCQILLLLNNQVWKILVLVWCQ